MPLHKNSQYSRKQMRNLTNADFSKKKTTPPVIPHGGSNTHSNQPHSPSDDDSVTGSTMLTPKY